MPPVAMQTVPLLVLQISGVVTVVEEAWPQVAREVLLAPIRIPIRIAVLTGKPAALAAAATAKRFADSEINAKPAAERMSPAARLIPAIPAGVASTTSVFLTAIAVAATSVRATPVRATTVAPKGMLAATTAVVRG